MSDPSEKVTNMTHGIMTRRPITGSGS